MPTPPLPNRAQIEAAPPLEFAPPPERETRTTIRIEVAPDGLHITAEYVGQLASIPAALERLRAAGVLELVQQSRPAGQAPAPAAQPVFGLRRSTNTNWLICFWGRGYR